MTTNLSQALADELAITPKEAADAAARYASLKAARYVTADGDVLSADEYKREVDQLNAYIKKFIENDGPFHVEGVGTFKVQTRAGDQYDIHAFSDMDFARARTLNLLEVNSKRMADARKRGDIIGPKPTEIITSQALVIDKGTK